VAAGRAALVTARGWLCQCIAHRSIVAEYHVTMYPQVPPDFWAAVPYDSCFYECHADDDSIMRAQAVHCTRPRQLTVAHQLIISLA
jgi:hypothetical protein